MVAHESYVGSTVDADGDGSGVQIAAVQLLSSCGLHLPLLQLSVFVEQLIFFASLPLCCSLLRNEVPYYPSTVPMVLGGVGLIIVH